jgi:hypothetical protein
VQRRITNVAPGIAPTDAATVGQLDTVGAQVNAQGAEIDSVNLNANRGIAMAMAQSGTTVPPADPGETSVGVGTGYYGGASALGFGLAHQNKAGNGAFSLATSITPGGNDIGVQAAMRWKVGHATPATAPTHDLMQTNRQIVDNSELQRLNVAEFTEITPNREYYVRFQNTPYRIVLSHQLFVPGVAPAWSAKIVRMAKGTASDDDFERSATLETLSLRPHGDSATAVATEAIRLAATNAQIEP